MKPNYIYQLNRFHTWLKSHYLPASAQLMWFRLIGLFNECGWEEWVQIDLQRLMSMIRAESKSSVLRARDALIDAGLLQIKKGKKGYPSRYRMLWFPADATESETEYGTEYETENETENETESETESVPETLPINKHKHKQNENKHTAAQERSVPPQLKDAWDAFAAMRRSIRKPLTADAQALILTELQKLAPGDADRQAEILNQSTMAAWPSVYPLKERPAQDERPRSYDVDAFERQLWDNPIVRGETDCA